MAVRSEINGCEHFEELSALALIGRVSSEENRELVAHLKLCSACREEYASFADILLDQLPLAHPDRDLIDISLASPSIPPAHRADFIEGTEDSQHTGPSTHLKTRMWAIGKPVPLYAYAAVLFLTIGLLAFPAYKHLQRDRIRAIEATKLQNELDLLRKQAEQRSREQLEKEALQGSDAQSREAKLMDDAHELNTKYAKLLAQDRLLQEQLKGATAQIQSMKTDVASSQSRESGLLARLSETEQNLAKMHDDMEKAQSLHSQDAGTIRAQQERLRETEDKLAAASVSIDRDRRLLAADRDIRDLMGARRLRVVDTFDQDGKGRTRKPFGRVFFTENKSLTFYAFDLGNQRPSAQAASYQAWGYEGSSQRGVRSLGIFYQDDQKANRWVLTFDDPVVLAEIDSVFVTIEPPGGSNKPTGIMLLSTYLKANINHP